MRSPSPGSRLRSRFRLARGAEERGAPTEDDALDGGPAACARISVAAVYEQSSCIAARVAQGGSVVTYGGPPRADRPIQHAADALVERGRPGSIDSTSLPHRMDPCKMKRLVGVDVPDTRDPPLVEEPVSPVPAVVEPSVFPVPSLVDDEPVPVVAPEVDPSSVSPVTPLLDDEAASPLPLVLVVESVSVVVATASSSPQADSKEPSKKAVRSDRCKDMAKSRSIIACRPAARRLLPVATVVRAIQRSFHVAHTRSDLARAARPRTARIGAGRGGSRAASVGSCGTTRVDHGVCKAG